MIYAVLGLCFFIVPIWAYRKGLQDGLNINQGKPIEPIKNPIQMVNEYRENKKVKAEQENIQQGLANLFAYDGTPQKVGDKDE